VPAASHAKGNTPFRRRPARQRTPRRTAAHPAAGRSTGPTPERTTANLVRRSPRAAAPVRRENESAALATRDALTLAHTDLVRRVAHRIGRRLPPHVDRTDLVSVGMMGLLDAAARYRPSTGVPFEAFARPRVHGAIMDALRQMDWVPRSIRALERKAVAAASILRQQFGREPSQDEIADRLGVKAETPAVGSALHEAMPGEPMQEALGTLEHCADPSDSAEAQLLREDLAAHIRRGMQRLPDRERRVLDGYYQHEHTMAEIGADIGVCESRVSQLRSAAIAELRRTLTAVLGVPPVTGWTPVVLTGGCGAPVLARHARARPVGAVETGAWRAA